ncbi:MAG: endonuclease/exonuclease/phosphatase family protein [Flavobacteriales bacterium]|nr:endonuclease/exonuclease/phosphatase family protein [Flavobacteriales bacterium]
MDHPALFGCLAVLSGILLIATAMPLIRHDFWTFRVFEFPRFQKWVINLVIGIAYILIFDVSNTLHVIVLSLLVVNFGYLSYQIYPYLPISPKQIENAPKGEDASIRILIYNVYQFNRKFEKLNALVQRLDADLVLMVETDKWWKDKSLLAFGDRYAHRVLEDQENTYGMLIFSKLPIHNLQVRRLIKEEVPSVSMELELKKGDKIKVYALHPEPPVPGENLHSTDRDAEILMIGKEAAEEKLPVIVAGDLNDVAWSYTSHLFQKISGLLDPRRGRGFFSSYHAKYLVLRWPLDHIFCSKHFRVCKMKRLPGIGSDHFPILVELYLSPVNDSEEALESDREDEETANEKIMAAL